jgi:hypothetical protein
MLVIVLGALLASLTFAVSPVDAQKPKQALQTCTLKISGMT